MPLPALGVGFWFGLAKHLLPLVLQLFADAQRRGHMNEGEKRLLAKQLAAFVDEVGIWDDIQTEVRDADERRSILTGKPRRVPPPENSQGGQA